MTVVVTGMAKALRDLSWPRYEEGLSAGLMDAGELMAGAARGVLSTRVYSGRTMRAVRARREGQMMVAVGATKAEAPALGPLTYGWFSRSGKQPPADALGGWASARGVTASTWAIARSIAEGRDQKRLDTFRRAYAEVGGELDRVVERRATAGL